MESIFGPSEAPACDRADVQPIYGTEKDNQIIRIGEEGNVPVLTSGEVTNPMEYNMAIICCIGIIIDYSNDNSK